MVGVTGFGRFTPLHEFGPSHHHRSTRRNSVSGSISALGRSGSHPQPVQCSGQFITPQSARASIQPTRQFRAADVEILRARFQHSDDDSIEPLPFGVSLFCLLHSASFSFSDVHTTTQAVARLLSIFYSPRSPGRWPGPQSPSPQYNAGHTA